MKFFVFLVVVALVALAIYLWRRGRAAQQTPPVPRDPFRTAGAASAAGGAEDDLRRLQPGAIVARNGTDFVVRGTLTFDEGGFTWAEHLLDDAAGTKRWLSVEDDEGLEVAIWESVPLADVEGEAGARSVVVHGVAYKLVESGTATFRAVGTTGTAESGQAAYSDYEAADGRLLSFERYAAGGSWEAGLGEKILPRELTIYPADTSR